MLFFRNFFKKTPTPDLANRIFAEIAAQSRRPVFYVAYGVPDSLDGRFELLCLHAYLIFRRLKGEGVEGATLSQAVYDAMFASLDSDLRELGAADIGVGRRIKVMTEALNGRIVAFDQGISESDDALTAALRRNTYGTMDPSGHCVSALARYIRAADRQLSATEFQWILSAEVPFPDPALFLDPAATPPEVSRGAR